MPLSSLSMLKQPIELQCSNLVCVACCCSWIEHRGELECPCCYDHQLGKDTVRQPSPVITDLMGQLKIQCNSCKNITTVQQYDHHRKSRCRLYFDSPQLSVHDILEKSPTTPTIPVEKRVAESLIRRLMAESRDESVIRVPTRGQVIIIT